MPPIPNLNGLGFIGVEKKENKIFLIEEVINLVFHFNQELELALYK